MAEVRLGRYEAETGALPQVCVCCGMPARLVMSRTFTWCPWWARLLLGGAMVYFITKRMLVQIPLCDDHRNHWTWRGVFLGVSFIPIGCLAIAATQFHDLWLIVAPLFMLLVLVAVILRHAAVRATRITTHAVTLTNVSEYFADAVRQERAAEHSTAGIPVEEQIDYEDDDDDELEIPEKSDNRRAELTAPSFEIGPEATPPRGSRRALPAFLLAALMLLISCGGVLGLLWFAAPQLRFAFGQQRGANRNANRFPPPNAPRDFPQPIDAEQNRKAFQDQFERIQRQQREQFEQMQRRHQEQLRRIEQQRLEMEKNLNR